MYNVEGYNYVSQFVDNNTTQMLLETSNNTIPDFNKAINYINYSDSSFYRISKSPYIFEDVPLIENYNSIGIQSSMLPAEYYNISEDLNNSQRGVVRGSREFDYRTKITTLLGVKYLINYESNNIPYGYEKLNEYHGNSSIYKNNYYLPFGVLYNSYITEEEYANLNAVEKESSLLKNVVLDDHTNLNNLSHSKYKNYDNIKELKYTIKDKNNIIIDENNIVIKENQKNCFNIEINDIKNSEIYIEFSNLKYEPFDKQKMVELALNEESISVDRAKAENNYKWYQPSTAYNLRVKFKNIYKKVGMADWTNAYYIDMKDFLLNLGYYDETSGTITVSLDSIGNYTFDDIKVYAVSMNDYNEDINNLRRSNFEAIEWDNGYLKGKVNAETDGILQFQTMYNNGWKVYVDGKEVETLKANKYFLGIEINSGEHEVYMEYHTPYLKTGVILSIVGLGIFISLCIYNNKKQKKYLTISNKHKK